MTLIGNVRYDLVDIEGPFKKMYNVSGDGRSLSSLHTVTVSGAEDSVVYYCTAGDAHCCRDLYVFNKNPSQHNLNIHLL